MRLHSKVVVSFLIALVVIGLSIRFGLALGDNRPVTLSVDASVEVIHALACSKDGRTLAASCDDATIVVWDLKTEKSGVLIPPEGRFLGAVKSRGTVYDSVFGQMPPIGESLAFYPNSETLVVGCSDDTIRFWNVNEKKQFRSIKLPAGKPAGKANAVRGVAVSGKGATIASASYDGVVRLWSADTGKLIRALEGHTDIVYAVAFSSDGRTLASCSADGTIRLWSVETGETSLILKGHTDYVRCVAFSPDGLLLASGGGDVHKKEPSSELKLWDAKSGKQLADLRGHVGAVHSVVFSADGKTLASAGGNAYRRLGEVILWNSADKKEIRRLGPPDNLVLSLAMSTDGTRLASAGNGNDARVWKLGSALKDMNRK